MRIQYFAFLSYMQNHFGDITNLFHSFEKIDGNMFGLCAYYLASPLNLLMLVGNIVDNIMLVALLKIGFCGLTSYLYFSYHTKGKTKQTFLLLLSTIYALSSYNMMYMLNIMWLDSAVLAPLVCLSIDYLQRKRKIAPYILTMAGTIFCNYYTGCMVGIFSALYFLWTFFQENTTKQEIWKAKKKILQFMLGAMLALGISTCILLPVLKDISDVRVSPGIQSFLTLKTECSLEQILARFWLLSFQGTDMSLGGAPNLLSTGLAFFLLLSYFTSSGEEKKKKVLTGIFLAILVLSVILQTTNLIWSGFNFPANGPYRYGFLLTLFFLTLAAKGASGIENEVQQKKKNALLTICTYFVLGSYLLVRNQISIASFLLSSAFFLGTIATLAYAKEKVWFPVVFAIVALELILNACQINKQIDHDLGFASRSETLIEKEQVQEVIDEVKESLPENQFYRIEKTFETTMADPMLYQYIGLNHYSSSTKLKTLLQYRLLGYTSDWLEILYRGGNTTFADSYCNLKYIIEKKEKTYRTEPIRLEKNEMLVRENETVFPFAYLVGDEIREVRAKNRWNVFDYQNRIYQALAQDTEDILIEALVEELIVYNLEEVSNGYRKQKKDEEAGICFYLTMQTGGPLYALLIATQQLPADVWVNGNLIRKDAFSSESGASETGIQRLGEFAKGDKVEVKLEIGKEQFTYQHALFYQEVVEKTKDLAKQLHENAMQIETIQDGKIGGKITVTNPEKSTLYLGIPYQEGWHLRVDGKETPIDTVIYQQMIVDLPEGEHEIELTFSLPGMATGIAISILSILASIFVAWREKRTPKESE